MPTHRTACPLDCPDACSLEVHVEGGRLAALEGTRDNPFTAGFICSKVRHVAEHLYGAQRLLTPGIRRGPKPAAEPSGRREPTRFEAVGWDEALDLVAARLVAARERSGGESILPLSYGGSNGLLTQNTVDELLFRRLGASRLLRTVCAAATTAAMTGLYGNLPGTALEDYTEAALVVIWGTNPSATGIHLVPVIKAARKRGAKLVVVDPRRTPLAAKADLHLALRPGTDLPVALAVIGELFRTGRADEAFLARHASGVDELRERAAAWTLERAAAEAGLERADLAAFVELYAATSPAVIRCGWGLERNRNGGSAVAAVLALPAVAGKLGVRGGGYTLSNSRAWSGDLRPGAFAVEPADPGAAPRAVNMNRLGRFLTEPQDPPLEVLFVYNNNGLATLPNQEAVRAGLAREDLFTVVFDQVLTDTAQYADVVLPATTFLEHDDVARGYGAPALQRVRPVVDRVGEARSNHEVFLELLRRTGLARPGDPPTAEACIPRVLADGERGARLADELQRSGLARPTVGTRPVAFADVFPDTPDGRVQLFPAHLDREAPEGLYAYRPDPATERHPLALISPATAKTISSTFGQLHAEPAPIELHPADAEARGIADGDRVRVFNELGEVRCLAAVATDLRPGTACLPKGLWSHNTFNGATSNALVPDTLTDLAGGACFNDARVEVERLADEG